MRHLVWMALLVSVGALTSSAQQRGAAPQRGMYGGVSTGRMVGVVGDPGFAGRLGATVSGLPQTVPVTPPGYYGRPTTYPGYNGPGFNGMYRGGRGGSGRTNTVVIPYAVPMYGGGGYGYGYEEVAPTAIVQQPVQQTPSVIINQYYSPDVVRPQLKEYTDLPPSGRQQEPQARVEARPVVVDPDAHKATITLLALKDSTVQSVIAYWLQGDTLYYITSNYKKMNVPAEMLDKVLSEKLNAERKVEFKLE